MLTVTFRTGEIEKSYDLDVDAAEVEYAATNEFLSCYLHPCLKQFQNELHKKTGR